MGRPRSGAGDEREVDSGRTEARSFSEAWVPHARELRRRCLYWMGGDRSAAEEALGRVAVRALHALVQRSVRVDNLASWLQRIAYTTCVELHREARRRPEVSLGDEGSIDRLARAEASDRYPTGLETPESLLLRKELESVLLRSIDALPERLRATVRLRLSSTSYREIAHRLSITEVNARKRMQEGRDLLRSRLAAYERDRLDVFTLRPERRPSERPETGSEDRPRPTRTVGRGSHRRRKEDSM